MPIQYAGGTNISATFTGAARSDIQSNVAAQLVLAGWTSLASVAGQGPGNVGTFTITIASPGVITFNSHGFLGGERVILQTTGALPTGLSVNTVYFVKYINANTFNLALTLGGANINTTGSQSGTHTVNSESFLMSTAATSQTLQIYVRLKDNRGSCIQVSIESTDGVLVGGNDTTHGGSLLPAAARTFRIIANKFQFFCFVPGTYATARLFCGAGVPYIPAPNTVPTRAGWMLCDSVSDASATTNNNWRSSLQLGNGSSSLPLFQVIWGATIWDGASPPNNTNNYSAPNLYLGGQIPLLANGTTMGSGNLTCYRWANGDIITADPLLMFGLSYGDEPSLRCQLFDALVIHDSFSGETTTTFDSHNWMGITNLGTGSGSNYPRGTVFLVTP